MKHLIEVIDHKEHETTTRAVRAVFLKYGLWS